MSSRTARKADPHKRRGFAEKWYAVMDGRNGPGVHRDLESALNETRGFAGGSYRVFPSQRHAEAYLSTYVGEDVIYGSKSRSHRYQPYAMGTSCRHSECSVSRPNHLDNDVSVDPVVRLDEQQQHVLEMALAGTSFFLTGSAGSGKTIVLKAVIKALKAKYGADDSLDFPAVAVTASTGVAADNIRGSTLHSFAGCGLGYEPAETYIKRLLSNGGLGRAMKWQECKVLIVDEVSMIKADFFDKLEAVARAVRNEPHKPWGGIQIICSGDFFQLPPVIKNSNEKTECVLAFKARTWKQSFDKVAVLTGQHRQSDAQLQIVLREIRTGSHLSIETTEFFQSLSRPLTYRDGIRAVQLFPLRCQARNYNATEMNRLPGKMMSYNSYDASGHTKTTLKPKYIDSNVLQSFLDQNLVAERLLELKVGAQVMLLKNLPKLDLVNGSLGRVIGFATKTDANNPANWLQSSPDLAIDEDLESDLNRVHVMQWRCTTEEAVRRSELGSLHYRVGNSEMRPVVRFTNGVMVLVSSVDFTVLDASGRVEGVRCQLPLCLAYSMSIHKSQGLSIDRLKVDLARVFEYGQAYVALSRSTEPSTLEVINFKPDKIMVLDAVRDWYLQLQSDI